MKNKTKKSKCKEKTIKKEFAPIHDELFDKCLRNGLIQKTSNGFYFTPEFFEVLNINIQKKYSKDKKKLSLAS